MCMMNLVADPGISSSTKGQAEFQTVLMCKTHFCENIKRNSPMLYVQPREKEPTQKGLNTLIDVASVDKHCGQIYSGSLKLFLNVLGC